MINLIVQLVIVVLVIGFLYWLYLTLIPLATFLHPLLRQVLDVLAIILVVGAILFYVIIPLLHALSRVRIGAMAFPLIG